MGLDRLQPRASLGNEVFLTSYIYLSVLRHGGARAVLVKEEKGFDPRILRAQMILIYDH